MVIPWKEALLDNLLLFAATPKGELFFRSSFIDSYPFFFLGMYLLTQTGFLSECVIYIDERWRSKGQVGKLERYGFGYLLSQMAITPAIVSRLDHSGSFVRCFRDQLIGGTSS